jgi:hypothetical protein
MRLFLFMRNEKEQNLENYPILCILAHIIARIADTWFRILDKYERFVTFLWVKI